MKGTGNQQDYGMRIYDPRLGRFLSVDPLTKTYPWYTPYQFAGNKPIQSIDIDGLEPMSVNVLRSISNATAKIVAGTSSFNYNGVSHTVTIASGVAVDVDGNVLAFTSKGGLAATLEFSQGGNSSDLSVGVAYSFSIYNSSRVLDLTSLLGTGSSVSASIGVDKFGIGPGLSTGAELDDNKNMIGQSLQLSFGFGAGAPMNLGVQKSNATGVIYAKAEFDKMYNTPNSLRKEIQNEIDNYNFTQAEIAGEGKGPNYAKALWQAYGGAVNISYEKVGENRFEIVFITSYLQYAQKTMIPANAPDGSYKDNTIKRSYRTGIVLIKDSNGNYVSETYLNQQNPRNDDKQK